MKYLLYKHEDCVQAPRSHVKPDITAHICNLSIPRWDGGGGRKGEPLEAHGPASLTYAAMSSKSLHHRQGGRHGWIAEIVLGPPQVHCGTSTLACTCVCTCIHTQTHRTHKDKKKLKNEPNRHEYPGAHEELHTWATVTICCPSSVTRSLRVCYHQTGPVTWEAQLPEVCVDFFPS